QLRIFAVHSAAVVHHADGADPSFFDLHQDPVRPCVDGVFNQLLHDGSRPFHHFSRRDLVDQPVFQDADSAHLTSLRTFRHPSAAAEARTETGPCRAEESGARPRTGDPQSPVFPSRTFLLFPFRAPP